MKRNLRYHKIDGLQRIKQIRNAFKNVLNKRAKKKSPFKKSTLRFLALIEPIENLMQELRFQWQRMSLVTGERMM